MITRSTSHALLVGLLGLTACRTVPELPLLVRPEQTGLYHYEDARKRWCEAKEQGLVGVEHREAMDHVLRALEGAIESAAPQPFYYDKLGEVLFSLGPASRDTAATAFHNSILACDVWVPGYLGLVDIELARVSQTPADLERAWDYLERAEDSLRRLKEFGQPPEKPWYDLLNLRGEPEESEKDLYDPNLREDQCYDLILAELCESLAWEDLLLRAEDRVADPLPRWAARTRHRRVRLEMMEAGLTGPLADREHELRDRLKRLLGEVSPLDGENLSVQLERACIHCELGEYQIVESILKSLLDPEQTRLGNDAGLLFMMVENYTEWFIRDRQGEPDSWPEGSLERHLDRLTDVHFEYSMRLASVDPEHKGRLHSEAQLRVEYGESLGRASSDLLFEARSYVNILGNLAERDGEAANWSKRIDSLNHRIDALERSGRHEG